jgi:hypothetical protein
MEELRGGVGKSGRVRADEHRSGPWVILLARHGGAPGGSVDSCGAGTLLLAVVVRQLPVEVVVDQEERGQEIPSRSSSTRRSAARREDGSG